MNTNEIKERLNEYFEYIKTIYINEFSKYINEETRTRILGLSDAIELKDDLTFKVINKDNKITFNLNLIKYIEENKLKNEESLKDLNEYSKNYIDYLVKNENNVFEIIKNKLLEQIILLFTNNQYDVVTVGTSKIICHNLSNKYKLPYENIIPSKEQLAVQYISQIVGAESLLKGVINNNQEEIASRFDMYNEPNSYRELISKMNKTYLNYNKKLGKMFLPDSLYEYEQINYVMDKHLIEAKQQKNDINESKLKRIFSIKNTLNNIYHHRIILNAYEYSTIESNIIEINKIIKRISENKNKNINNYIENEYGRALDIEDDSKQVVSKLWSNYLTPISNYNKEYDFSFLFTKNIDKDIIEANVITSDMLREIRNIDLGYGYIIEPKDKGILCSSTKKIKDTTNIKDIINDSEESILTTPDMISKSNLSNKKLENTVLLDSSKVYVVGLYCFTDENLEESPNYLRAVNLKEEHNLPIITINQYDYYMKKEKVHN